MYPRQFVHVQRNSAKYGQWVQKLKRYGGQGRRRCGGVVILTSL